MDRWFVRGAVVVLLGLGLIAVPVSVLGTPEQSQVVVHVDKVGATEPNANGDEIANYRSLDSRTRSVFDDGRSGTVARVNAETAGAVLEDFTAQPYVEYSGAYYHVRYVHRPDSYTTKGALSVLLTMFGGLVVAWGVLTALVGSFKPFNSLSALGVPVAATLAIVLSPAAITNGVDVPPTSMLVTFPPMSLLFVGGALVGGGHLVPLVAIVGAIVLTIVVSALVIGAPAVAPFLFTGVILGGGFPWLVLGWLGRKPKV